MNTIRISATKARNSFFDLLNKVMLGTEVIVERDNKEVAVIAPRKTKMDWEGLIKASKAAHGIFKGLSFKEISPLRKKGAWKRLGTWDKGLKLKNEVGY